MKPAREPASSRPKPCASLKKPHESCPFAAPCWPSYEENRPLSEIRFPLRNLPVFAFDSRAQGFSTPLARRQTSCPPSSPNLVRTHPIECYQALRDSAPRLSRAATSRSAPNWSSQVACIWEHHSQPIITLPPRLSRSAESQRQPVGCISRGWAGPYTRRKDPSTLIPRKQVSEGEGTKTGLLLYKVPMGVL